MRAKYTFGLTSALRLLSAASLFWAPARAAATTAGNRVALQIERATRADPELGAFYATRNNRPLWSIDGRLRPEAAMVVGLLRTANLDGLNPSNYLRNGVERAVFDAATGNPGSLARAEVLLSHDFVAYVRDVRCLKTIDVVYAEPGLKRPVPRSQAILQRLASAPDMAMYLRNISWMHPVYARLRNELAAEVANDEGSSSRRVALLKANLDRASILPAHQDIRLSWKSCLVFKLPAYPPRSTSPVG